MDSINDLLASLSEQDMEKIKSAAAGLMGNAPTQAGESPAFSDDMSNMLLKVASQMNKDSDKTAFIKALRPLLSDERQKRADEAMHFLKLMDTLPLLRGMFQ
jgi:hypothetical protein